MHGGIADVIAPNLERAAGRDELCRVAPVTKPEMTMYPGTERADLPHRPGVTGIWQVSGRNQVVYDHRVELDIAYLDKASMLFDIKVIAKTMLAVINLEGR